MQGGAQAKAHPYLAYALPRERGDANKYVVPCGEFELHDVPLGAPESFLDYEGVVVFAGAFEDFEQNIWDGSQVVCLAPEDLDRRTREVFTAAKSGKALVFLVPDVPDRLDAFPIEPTYDLFRRIVDQVGIGWRPVENPVPHLSAEVREFADYVGKYGTGYVTFPAYALPDLNIRELCKSGDNIFGIAIADKIFALPCTVTQDHQQAVDSAIAALKAVIAYRKRVSKEMPKWLSDFRFEREAQLEGEADSLRSKWKEIRTELDAYQSLKGALCFRSDPLVQTVSGILKQFFDLEIKVDDKCIEDAVLTDEDGNVLAVFEIKGVNRNFERNDVNQVDSHRERLKLPPQTPGILIINTMMKTRSLSEKDVSPHPDNIKKAVADHVLMIRTLDLLRYADGVEAGQLRKEDFRETMLTEDGWLKVENGQADVVRE